MIGTMFATCRAHHPAETGFADLGVTHASLRFGWPGTPRKIVEGAICLAAREVLPALR